MTTLPIVNSGNGFRRPSILDDYADDNGQLPASLLTSIPMPGGGTAVVLKAVAPKWQAMLAAAARAGFPFSQNGDYRPLVDQVRLLHERYVVVPKGSAYDISYGGEHWRKKPGMATVATPGKSNHGWGLALDLCLPGGRSLTDAAVAWLVAHAREYGISAELSSENWHWRPYDGDAMTPAVTRFAALSTQEEDMAPRIITFAGEDQLYGAPGTFVGGLPVLVPLTDWERVKEWIASGVPSVIATYEGRPVPLNRTHWHITETDAWPDTVPAATSVGGVDVAALAAALVADPGLRAALEQAAFVGAQKAERE